MHKGVKFNDRNVAADPTAMTELKALGYMTTPVIIVGGKIIIGFDATGIDSALSDESLNSEDVSIDG